MDIKLDPEVALALDTVAHYSKEWSHPTATRTIVEPFNPMDGVNHLQIDIRGRTKEHHTYESSCRLRYHDHEWHLRQFDFEVTEKNGSAVDVIFKRSVFITDGQTREVD